MNIMSEAISHEVLQMLLSVRDIIANGWDREWASDQAGNQVDEWDDYAVNFNIQAAFLRAYYAIEDITDIVIYQYALQCVDAVLYRQGVAEDPSMDDWQRAPERTQAHVLAIIDEALHEVVQIRGRRYVDSS